ncbi:2'-5' RNA ligase family protein [Hymenobacter sp. HD11105]|jgi:2'-5' RNA ligase
MTDADAPLILTLALDAESFAFFNGLRQQYFPPERNFLAAHVTLFHHLPGARRADLVEQLAARCQEQAPLTLQVTGVRFMGRGSAYVLENEALQALHRELQTTWQPALTPQDQQKLRPHVTVQNKVDPQAARALYEQLKADFVPFEATGTGLQLWAYRGGPWEAIQTFDFR